MLAVAAGCWVLLAAAAAAAAAAAPAPAAASAADAAAAAATAADAAAVTAVAASAATVQYGCAGNQLFTSTCSTFVACHAPRWDVPRWRGGDATETARALRVVQHSAIAQSDGILSPSFGYAG